ncbi:MAG: hypothetical protein GC162_20700 [Planctomycetes bacterium]|nr:hypothetical protein [Planctomycetota bacterium]
MSANKVRETKYAWFTRGMTDWIAAVAADRQLRQWVVELAQVDDAERSARVSVIAEHMRATGAEPQFVAVIESLRHRPMFEGMMRTLGDVA